MANVMFQDKSQTQAMAPPFSLLKKENRQFKSVNSSLPFSKYLNPPQQASLESSMAPPDMMSSSDKSTAFIQSDLNYNSASGRSNQSMSMSYGRHQSVGATYSSGSGSNSLIPNQRPDNKSQPPRSLTLNQIISQSKKQGGVQNRRRYDNNNNYLETINSEREQLETEGGTSSIIENTKGFFSFLANFRF